MCYVAALFPNIAQGIAQKFTCRGKCLLGSLHMLTDNCVQSEISCGIVPRCFMVYKRNVQRHCVMMFRATYTVVCVLKLTLVDTRLWFFPTYIIFIIYDWHMHSLFIHYSNIPNTRLPLNP